MARNVHIAIRRGKAHSRRASLLLVAATALLAVAFGLGKGAQAAGPPVLKIGPINVNDGTAVVTGTVGGDSTAEVDLKVNGQNVGVDVSGAFNAVVDLDGESFLVLQLASSEGEITTIRIPVAILGNGIEGVLDDLEQAGVSLEIPPDGFQIVDGQMPVVSGRVLNGNELASLTVNGRNVLDLLGPGGGFTVLPGSTSERVTVVATDKRGVSETTSFRTSAVTTTIKTPAGTSVSALGARGIVIAKVRFDKRKLRSDRRLGVLVQVKDRRGYLIRGAAVRIKGMPLRYLANGATRAGFTNRFGLKRFAYKLHKRAFTDSAPRRLTLVVRASTPRAVATKVAKVRLPLLPST